MLWIVTGLHVLKAIRKINGRKTIYLVQRCPAWLRKLLYNISPCLTFFLTLWHWLWQGHRIVNTWLSVVTAGRWWVQPGRWKKEVAFAQSSGSPITTGSKKVKGKTTAWCAFRNEVRYSEKGIENWESSWVLMLAFARRCVSLHFHSYLFEACENCCCKELRCVITCYGNYGTV